MSSDYDIPKLMTVGDALRLVFVEGWEGCFDVCVPARRSPEDHEEMHAAAEHYFGRPSVRSWMAPIEDLPLPSPDTAVVLRFPGRQVRDPRTGETLAQKADRILGPSKNTDGPEAA